jgi:two-component system sensor histidine kinase/response regulator
MTFSDSYPFVSVCQPVEDALRRQVEQERVLNQVTTQIRQSLELPVILETAVQQVRDFLKVDRLLIYQFDPYCCDLVAPSAQNAGLPTAPSALVPLRGGRITYEATASETIASALDWAEPQSCFTHRPLYHEKYRQGATLAVQDIEVTYIDTPCFLKLLRQFQVRAKLVTPIVIQEQLWGLVIAHQCSEPRTWEDNEQRFLRHIAEHLAIAIYQAQLYAQLQQQKQTLEHQVIERTQELRDTLLTAQAANRAKSEFLANVSHEFRTPLTAVIGMSATLLRWPLDNLSSKQRHYLQTIHDSGKHLLELINDILDLSQLEAGKMVLKVRDFSLTRVAMQSLETLKESAERNNIRLELWIQDQPFHRESQTLPQDLYFRADRRRVRQILLNLLSNAVKFTPAGGRVALRIWLENSKVALQVEDTGIGIAGDQIPLLFQKFQQLDASYQREYQGTGLGLALTKQLVDLHSGWIDIDSTVDVGSIFTVWLPIQALHNHLDSLPISNTGRIVLIASQEDSARSLCDLLTTAGHQVIWMVESSSAVAQIRHLNPQLVILNLQAAEIDGADVIHQLRSLPGANSFKILLLHPPEAALELADLGSLEVDDYGSQSIQPDEFLAKVSTLIAATQRS